MGIRIVTGRAFAETDRDGQPRVLLINQTLARRDFVGENPVGQTVFIGPDIVPWQIVGVVNDVRQFGLDREPEPQVFADFRQWSGSVPLFPVGAYYAVRTVGDPMAIVANVRRTVQDLDQQAALFNIEPMEQLVTTTIARPRLYTVLLSIFASVGVVLALIGVYGVTAYGVTQRTREIGIRMALGAQSASVMRLVLCQGLMLTAIGMSLGLTGAAAASGYLKGMLFGLTPLDPMTFVAVSLTFVAVATLATFVPARRASKVDPMIALRCE
jgi:predicted permease